MNSIQGGLNFISSHSYPSKYVLCPINVPLICSLIQSVLVAVSEKMTVEEVLEAALNKRQLIPNDHFIRLKLPGSDSYKMPDKSSLLQSEVCTVLPSSEFSEHHLFKFLLLVK